MPGNFQKASSFFKEKGSEFKSSLKNLLMWEAAEESCDVSGTSAVCSAGLLAGWGVFLEAGTWVVICHDRCGFKVLPLYYPVPSLLPEKSS